MNFLRSTISSIKPILPSQDDKVTMAATATAVAGSTSILVWMWWKRHLRAVRRARLTCACGKVQGEIHQPARNYKFMDTSCIQCACTDCVGFCKAALNVGSRDGKYQDAFFNPGVPTVFLYDSEIKITKGQEEIEHMKLTKWTENRRVFAKCCGTPLSICPDFSHLCLVYTPLLTPVPQEECNKGEVPFPSELLDKPSHCIFVRSMESPEASPPKSQPQMIRIHSVFAPLFILRTIRRLALLMIMGEYGPGTGFPITDGKTVGIGYETLVEKIMNMPRPDFQTTSKPKTVDINIFN